MFVNFSAWHPRNASDRSRRVWRNAPSDQPLSREEGLKLIRAAARKYPGVRSRFDDPAVLLMQKVTYCPVRYPDYIPAVSGTFAEMSEGAQDVALRLLAEIGTRQSLEAYVRLLATYAREREGEPGYPIALPLERNSAHADVLFPALLEQVEAPGLTATICYLALTYLQQGVISPDLVDPYAVPIVSAYSRLRDRLAPLQRPCGTDWIWNDAYQRLRVCASVCLELLGYLPPDLAAPALQAALHDADPRLRCTAIASALRLGLPVLPQDVVLAAAEPETRNATFEALEQWGRLDLCPEAYRTQTAFAESDMVGWLTCPAEMGQAPDAIELMDVAVETGEGGEWDTFLFRFRSSHPAFAGQGWMAGISGPYPYAEEPSPGPHGPTFSWYERWEARSPEGHLAELTRLRQESSPRG